MTENEDLLAKIGQLAGKEHPMSDLPPQRAHWKQAKSIAIRTTPPSLISPNTYLAMHLRIRDGRPILEAEEAVVLQLRIGIAHWS